VPTTTPTPGATQTVTFDDLAGQDVALNGQYPTGLIDWGSGVWYLSSPYGQFPTKSVSFSGPGITSGTFTFLTPRRLVSIDAYDGGTSNTLVTVSCAGQPSVSFGLAANSQPSTVPTNWTGTCTSVTITSSNSWDTNFDNLTIR
jgi:hypothetical protein